MYKEAVQKMPRQFCTAEFVQYDGSVFISQCIQMFLLRCKNTYITL